MFLSRHLSARTIVFSSLICLLVHCTKSVATEEYVYGSDPSSPENNIYGSEMTDQENNCQNNELPDSITPDVYGNIHMQALRRKLWRILSSPAMNENIAVPNYEALSDGRLLYEIASQNGGHLRNWWHPNFKRNIGAILKSKSIPISMKRSIATLAKNGQFPSPHLPEEDNFETDEVMKRNIASMARGKSIEQHIKRSLQALARNSHFPDKDQNQNAGSYFEYTLEHLPAQHYYYDVGKKNIGSLAKSGQLQNPYRNIGYEDKRNIQYVMKNGGVAATPGKRNIASLIRTHNMPEHSKDEQSESNKRNIGAIARDWALPNHSTSSNKNSDEKRNVAALLRQDAYLHSNDGNSGEEVYPTPDPEEEGQYGYKRNIGSIKSGKRDFKRSVSLKNHEKNNLGLGRRKRQADEYFTENAEDYNPVLYKASGNDYDDFVRNFAGDYFYNQKRFLGNIPLSRMTELGKISLMSQPNMSNATPTSPTYRRKQYLLSRTIPGEPEEQQ